VSPLISFCSVEQYPRVTRVTTLPLMPGVGYAWIYSRNLGVGFGYVVAFVIIVALVVRHWMRANVDVGKVYRNKTILITGASSGIGRELALQLSRYDNRLFLVARREDRLREVVQQCQQRGSPKTAYACCDLEKESECKTAVSECIRQFGGVDVLVLNAARTSLASFEDISDLGAYRRLMDVNYWANVTMTMVAMPYLKANAKNAFGSQLIVISSLAGKIGAPGRTGYSPTKFALAGFYGSLRCELSAKYNIRISVVFPGFVDTEIHHNAFMVPSSTGEGGEGDRQTASMGDRRNLREFMTVEKAAALTLAAGARGDREYIMTLMGQIGAYLIPFFPSVLDAIAVRKSRDAFAGEKKSS